MVEEFDELGEQYQQRNPLEKLANALPQALKALCRSKVLVIGKNCETATAT